MTRRVRATALIGLGVVLIVAAVVVWAIGSQHLVRFRGAGFDLTEHDIGSVVVQASPTTGAPQSGATLPLDLRRRMHGIGETDQNVVVQEDDTEVTGTLPPLTLTQRYVLAAGSAQNVSSPRAFAYTPANVVDRSGAYSVALPPGAGRGPYPMWRNETGSTVRLTSAGTVHANGLTLTRFAVSAQAVPLDPAFLAQLGQQGLPQTLTIQQLTPQLAAAGIDTGAVNDAIAQLDDQTDQATARELFTAPVPMAYSLSTDEVLRVEPVSGTVVAVERADQTVGMTPQISQLGRLQLILGQPRYAGKPVVATGAAALARLASHPPATPYVRATYSQEATSVAQAAAYARSRAGAIQLWTRTVPLVLAVLGLIALVVGLVLGTRRRRSPARGL